ncbi:MAG: filamentous hemagglutinin outer membrane protein, partial [Pseudomonadota bacterium]
MRVVMNQLAPVAARSAMVPAKQRLLLGTALAIAAASVAGEAGAQTLPQDGSVVAGAATILTAPNQLDVQQTSDRVVIDWHSFSIGQGDTVNFLQPSASAIALNRVIGGDPSTIQGSIRANGKVFLLNPNGVLFSPTASVDAGAIIASTLNLSNDDFLAGRYRFSGAGLGAIVNQERLTAHGGANGGIALISARIQNLGALDGQGGNVALGAGNAVLLDLGGPLQLAVDAGAVGALIENGGAISSANGAIYLTARGVDELLRTTINNTGLIDASGLSDDHGRITLDAGPDGTLENRGGIVAASAGRGGDITLLGGQVGLLDAARVDASGAAGGGTILIGGDYQGGGDLPHARSVVLGLSARVTSDALATGDGGRIILWSDAYTGVYGRVSAQGGANGGTGGFVETSSKQQLEAFGSVDVSAPAGAAGRWLLDPTNVTIGSTGDSATYTVSSGTYAPNNTTGVTIAASTIASALASGNVTINTTSAGAQVGDITVSSAITKASGATATTLTLNAANNINVNAAISGSANAPLNITLNAANNAASATGGVSVAANLSSYGGKILIGGAGGSLSNAVVQGIGYALNATSSTPAVSIGNAVTIASQGGSITINGLSNVTGQTAYGIDLGASSVVNSGTGNLYINGRNNNAGATNKAYGVNIQNGSSSTSPTTIGTTTGLLQLDAYSAAASTNALNLASSGTYTTISLVGPNVAAMRVTINGSIQASTFTTIAGCTPATNYTYCGKITVPGANGSGLYGGYSSNYSATVPLYVSWTSGTKVYDGTTTASGLVLNTNYTLTSSASLPNDFTPSFTLASKNVGTYSSLAGAVNSFASSNGTSYAVAYFNDGTYTVTAKPLTMSGLSVPSSKIYDGTTAAVISGTAALQAFQAAGAGTTSDGKAYTGDAVSITGTPVGTYNSKDVGSASSVTYSGLSLSGADAGNYSLTIQSSAAATITAKSLAISGLSVTSKVYDATTGATLTGTAGLLTAQSPGSGTTSDGKAYTGDTVSITGTPSGVFANANIGSGKAVTVSGLSLTGASAGNYTLSNAISGTITAKALTMSGLTVPSSKVYDGTTAAVVGGAAALLAAQSPGSGTSSDGKAYTGDTVNITGTAVGTYNSKDVGSATSVTFSGLTLTGGSASNYTLTQQTAAQATITAKALTMSGLSVPTSKTYDGTTAAVITGTAALQSFETAGSGSTSDGKAYTGDTVNITGTAAGTYNSRNVGSASSVSFSGLSLGGAQAGNYSLTLPADAAATITAKALTVSGVSVSNKVYDATTNAVLSGTPSLQAAIAAGTGSASDGTPYSGDAVSVSGSAQAQFVDANVGTAKAVAISGLSLTGGDAGNYSIASTASVAANITAKALTMSGLLVPASKTYDGTAAAVVSGTAALLSAQAPGTGTSSDGAAYTGDTVSLTGTAVGTYNSKNVGSASTITFSGLSLTGTQAGNYSLTLQAPEQASILALQLTPVASSKVYDGTDSAAISATGVIAGDDVTFNYTSGSFAQKDVGSNIAVTASGITLTGTEAGNYTLGGTSVSANASITARALTISAPSVAGKTYDGTTSASITAGTLGNLV